jgi:hypothetical protein
LYSSPGTKLSLQYNSLENDSINAEVNFVGCSLETDIGIIELLWMAKTINIHLYDLNWSNHSNKANEFREKIEKVVVPTINKNKVSHRPEI